MAWCNEIPTNETLDQWIENNYNVLFHGRHGVGKTSMIFDAFKRQGWELGKDFLYFSGPTIDPVTDLNGVPYVVTDEQGNRTMKIIRPSNIDNINLKAIFIDEVNRSHKKVRNALMELIQFKTMNGVPFPGLRIVWAAVNPDNDDDLKFDVEKLDPAQEDRFEIHIEIPYEPNKEYFAEKFKDPDMATAICKWWKDQSKETQLNISPRRLEYAINVFKKTDELRYTMPIDAKLSTLRTAIHSGNPEKTLQNLIANGDETEIRKWLAVDNNLVGVEKLVCRNTDVMEKVLHLISDERLTSFAAKHKPVQEQLKATPKKYARVIKDLAENSTNKILKNMCEKLLPLIGEDHDPFASAVITTRSRADLKLTKRRREQIVNNYKILKDYKGKSFPKSQDSSEKMLSFIMDISFSSNLIEVSELLEKLSYTIHEGMTEQQTGIMLKIVEKAISEASSEDCSAIINNSDVICFLVHKWSKIYDFDMSKLFEYAPYLVTQVLCRSADMTEKSGIASDFCIHKTGNEEYLDISEEMEYKISNDLNDILGV